MLGNHSDRGAHMGVGIAERRTGGDRQAARFVGIDRHDRQHAGHCLTGAGVSAASGLPTFREAQTGLWAQYKPEDLATSAAFVRDPKLVWEWYAWRRSLVAKARPNDAHRALAEMERRVPTLTLITQNVDGLHQQAGSGYVIELHGNINRVKCFSENVVVERWAENERRPAPMPALRRTSAAGRRLVRRIAAARRAGSRRERGLQL